MAGLHGDIQAGLSDGSTVRVDGVQWFSLAAGTRMENIYAGDGNDSLTGSTLANEIYGARGNDLLSGLGGADTLVGGQGNDRLIGGAGPMSLNSRGPSAATGSRISPTTWTRWCWTMRSGAAV
ncbi:MAG: hypothetical protein HZT43_00070 [Exiguobacterium profundum]|nr:MAG: hypothetical protein HZT43_00070 [Exiguobacterium profundum]